MKLLVLPDDGLAPIVAALRGARRSIRIAIFRCDLAEVEEALGGAVARGVDVHALIAHTNRAGEKLLRRLELRLLGAGVKVSRTDDDLVRYHDKLVIVDERALFVLGFNFTRKDLGKRGLGIATRQHALVAEAVELFDADASRQPFGASAPQLVVSPLNARARLASIVESAQRSLCIYDPHAIDRALLRRLAARTAAGVKVRVIGQVGAAGQGIEVGELPTMKLHARAILRDDTELFVGSQGLRGLELDRRREVGVLVRDPVAVARMRELFEKDWASGAKASDRD